MSILIEHTAGKWPFFCSPRQIMVVPISEKANEYCEGVALYYQNLGYDCEMYSGEGSLNKKIRNSQLAQWNYILVAGETEAKNGTVNVRTRANEVKGEFRVDDFADTLIDEIPKSSAAHTNYFAKMWKPENYGLAPKAGAAQAEVAVAAPVKTQGPTEVKVPYHGAQKASAKVNDKDL